jgi:hypothetical protein
VAAPRRHRLRFLGDGVRLSVLTIVEPVADKLAKTPAASARQVLSPGSWREDCVARPSMPPIQLLIGERLRVWVQHRRDLEQVRISFSAGRGDRRE